jgi:hypothetical protein
MSPTRRARSSRSHRRSSGHRQDRAHYQLTGEGVGVRSAGDAGTSCNTAMTPTARMAEARGARSAHPGRGGRMVLTLHERSGYASQYALFRKGQCPLRSRKNSKRSSRCEIAC